MKVNKIAGYRAMLGLTQKDLAKKLKVTSQTYSNKERGIRHFNDKEKVELLNILKKAEPTLTIDNLFFLD